MPAEPRDPLLIELIAAIGAGGLEFGSIHDETEYVHGVTLKNPRGVIRIDPSADVVATVLHETIHRMRPRWSERAVRSRTSKILKLLSPSEVDRLYMVIMSTAKQRKVILTTGKRRRRKKR